MRIGARDSPGHAARIRCFPDSTIVFAGAARLAYSPTRISALHDRRARYEEGLTKHAANDERVIESGSNRCVRSSRDQSDRNAFSDEQIEQIEKVNDALNTGRNQITGSPKSGGHSRQREHFGGDAKLPEREIADESPVRLPAAGRQLPGSVQLGRRNQGSRNRGGEKTR
jgi:hypothetical protein